MGCWNQTCMISNLPIMHGEEVVAFILQPYDDGLPAMGGGSCYAYDLYKLFPIPLSAEYNDYGGIENIHSPTSDIYQDVFGDNAQNISELAERDEKANGRGKYCLAMAKKELFDYLTKVDKKKKENMLSAAETFKKDSAVPNISYLIFSNQVHEEHHLIDWVKLSSIILKKDNPEPYIDDVLRSVSFMHKMCELRKTIAPQCGQGMQHEGWNEHYTLNKKILSIIESELIERNLLK